MWQPGIAHQVCQEIASRQAQWRLVHWCALGDALTEAGWPYLGAYVVAEHRHLPRSRYRHRVRYCLRWEDWLEVCLLEVRLDHYYLSVEWVDRQVAGEADDLLHRQALER
jgi:hypothetical protein